MSDTLEIGMTVDGVVRQARASPRYLLSDFLREQAGAGGVHVACGQGVCGACTVVVDGVAVRACLMLAVQAHGCDVRTVASQSVLEGVAADGDGLTPLQRAFVSIMRCNAATARRVCWYPRHGSWPKMPRRIVPGSSIT